MATPASRGDWSACCQGAPGSPSHLEIGRTRHAPLRTLDYSPLSRQRAEVATLLNYLNLFISHQVRTGRYQELYKKWVGAGSPPDLTIPGVYE
jgi:hypothetical protein